MKKNHEFDIFENADENTLSRLSDRCTVISSEREKIYRMIAKKLGNSPEKFETEHAYEVKGVDLYMRPKWFKSVMTAVICCLLVVGLFSGAFILKRNSAKNKEVQTESQGISVPATNAQGRTVITIGFTGDIGYLTKRISSYNNSQKSYQLEVIDYTQKDGKKSWRCSERLL